ncbi:MAG TPA: HAMP domain-containing sensor histidine kinase [Kofleriaceae bacterium]|nr:HAMP domain-containing sensor histidine kinase [Kofleriaceae bacterium]
MEDDTEKTSPRFASGTCEIAKLATPLEPPQRDLPHEEVARIVHDFKGPLGTIGLEVELLGENVASGVAVEGKPIIDRIMRNIAFLDRMVMDLLDLCTLEAGRFELRRVPTELRALLEQVIERVVPTRDRKRVVLDARESVIVDIDDLRIERVVANFLHNALKYAPPGTGIIVKLDREPGMTRVSVIDAGHGLTRLELGNIFDEYHRGAPAMSRNSTGLGLFLSKQIIEAHGATIGVDSIRGEGTRFYFELPTTS